MRRRTSLQVGLIVVVSACQTQVAPTSTTPTPPTTPTTVAAVTSTSPVSSTSTLASTTTSEPPSHGPDWYWPEPEPGSEGAMGSGCAPGAEVLPDGFWFGVAVEHRSDEIVFDLACWFDDPDADNGYRIGNENPNLRTIQLAEDAVVWRVDLDVEGGLAPPVSYPEWVGNYSVIVSCPGDFCLVWLHTVGGVVQEMVEQYVP